MSMNNKILFLLLICIFIKNIESKIKYDIRSKNYSYNVISNEYRNFNNLSIKELSTNIIKKKKNIIIEKLNFLKDNLIFFISKSEKEYLQNLIDKLICIFTDKKNIENSILKLFKLEEKESKNFIHKPKNNYFTVDCFSLIDRIVLWNLYSNNIEDLLKKFDEHKNKIFYLSLYPLIDEHNNKTLNKIRFDEFITENNLNDFFISFAINNEINIGTESNEILNNLIQKRIDFINILKENNNSIEKINLILNKIKADMKNISEINFDDLEDDYKELIEEATGNFSGIISSSFGYWTILESIIRVSENHLTKTFYPNEKMNSNKSLLLTLMLGKLNLFHSFSSYVYRTGLKNSVDNFMSIDNGSKAAFSVFGLLSIFALQRGYKNNKKDLKKRKNLYETFNTYYNSLKNIIINSKILNKEILEIYNKNNINLENYLPEIELFNNNLENINQNNILKGLFKNWSNSKADLIKNVFIPYFIIKEYFDENLNKNMHTKFISNENIALIYNFIGSVDLSLKKIELIKKNERLENKYSTVNIISDNSFIAKDFWYPIIKDNIIMQDLILHENNRNILLISPFAGGKTTALSSILFLNYILRTGIASCKNLSINSFNNIIAKFETEYEIGAGFSKHMKEIKDIDDIKLFLKNSNDYLLKNNSLIIIDEVYNGVSPYNAAIELVDDGRDLFENKNNKIVFTTHYIELLNLTKIKNYFMNLYYLKVDFIPEKNSFYRTFKLFENDENNWWFSDNNKLKALYREFLKKNID